MNPLPHPSSDGPVLSLFHTSKLDVGRTGNKKFLNCFVIMGRALFNLALELSVLSIAKSH